MGRGKSYRRTQHRQARRGQLQHAFSFMLVAIVIVATLFLGATLINKTIIKGCEAQDQRLVRQLHEAFATYDSYGTRQTAEFSASCDAKVICFVPAGTNAAAIKTLSPPFADSSSAKAITTDERLQLSAAQEAEVGANVFLIRDGLVKEIFDEPKIETAGPFLCVPSAGGIFYVKATGKGKTILLSEVG